MSACPYHRYAIDYADDQLDPGLRAEYERHLAGCPSCRGEQKELASMFALLGKEEIADPGPEFWAHVRQAARRQNLDPRYRPMRWWLRFLPALAPILAAAVWLLVVHSRSNSTIDLPVPLENIVQSEDLGLLSLDALVDDSLYQHMTAIERFYEPEVDDAISELDEAEQRTLIQSIEERYGEKS